MTIRDGIVRALISRPGVFAPPSPVEPGSGAAGDAAPDLRINGWADARIRDILGYHATADGGTVVTAVIETPYDFGPDLVMIDARRLVIT